MIFLLFTANFQLWLPGPTLVLGAFIYNTQGTAGGPGGRDRTLAVKSRKNEKLFRTWEIPWSGSKAKDLYYEIQQAPTFAILLF